MTRRWTIAAIAALFIGIGAVTTAQVEPAVEHVSVRQGEGLWQVAQRLCPHAVGAEFTSLQQANPWYTVGLKPGTVLHRIEGSCPEATTSTSPVPTSGTVVSSTTTIPTGQLQTVNVGATTLRSSSLTGTTTETIGGVTYEVITNRHFVVDGGYLLIDEPNILIRDSTVTGGRRTVNTGAMIQTASAARNVRVERTAFDGGPIQNRGIQSDTANLFVYNSSFHRTGNAAVEKNDRNQQSDFTVENSTITGTGGWPTDDHVDGLQVGGARNVTIRNNLIDLATYGGTPGDAHYVANSCLGLWAELGNTGTTLVEGNRLLHCGGSVVYLEQKSPWRWTSTVTFRNNRIGREPAVWFILAPVGLPASLTWTGNVWDDTGTTIGLAEAQRCCVTN